MRCMSVCDGKKIVKTYTGVSLELFYSFLLELAFDRKSSSYKWLKSGIEKTEHRPKHEYSHGTMSMMILKSFNKRALGSAL